MDESFLFLYETVMRKSSVFVENYQHLPEPEWLACGFSVLRAGKVEAATGYAVERTSYPGQDLLYCLDGQGTVESGGRRIAVGAGQLVWIANESPHAHRAREDDPWTLLWLRLDGPGVVACRERLFGDLPSRAALPRALAEPWFGRLFELLRRRSRDADLELNHLVGELFVLLSPAEARAGGRGERPGGARDAARGDPGGSRTKTLGTRRRCARWHTSVPSSCGAGFVATFRRARTAG